MYDDLCRSHSRVAEADRGEAVGERLDQVDRLAGDDRLQRLRQRAVVDGVGEVVASAGRRQVDVQRHGDDEQLAVTTFVRQHAVAAVRAQAAQLDPVVGEGMIMGFVDYNEEMKYFGEKVLPLMKEAGLRH